jgi:hypothetical protein
MCRPPLSRLVGSLVTVLVALSASIVPLAHGYAHYRLHDERTHEQAHHGAELDGAQSAWHDAARVEIGATDHSDDHGHPQVSSALSGRAELKVLVGPAPAPVLIAQIELTESASLLLTAAPARAGPPDAPPRPPRAPPLG